MNIADPKIENAGPFTRACGWHKLLPNKIVEMAKKIKKLGQDDPRRIIHSLKVGLALTLVSLFYYIQPLYDRIGENSIWAVITVILVFEFSVGATLGKGLNRMLATLSAGALGVGVHHLATLSGEKGEPIVLGFFVAMIAATVTFVRFFPTMKARYDYGLLIFILTFSLVSVSGYREDKVLQMAHQRVTTIIMGSIIAIVICICIRPVWIGEELQNLIANNIEKLGNFLQGFGSEFFKISEDRQPLSDIAFIQGYKSLLTSKNNEETMTLNEFGRKIQEPSTKICSESGKALRELASAVKKMNQPTSVNAHIENSKTAIENLKFMLDTYHLEDADLQEIMPSAEVALTLIDVVPCIVKIADAVQELASLAHFKTPATRVSP
ncbi:aluminum-activated malate transporter 8-like isoform X2 [Quercus robur]|uniref:aluminum-activated malate transporter 8-like isoform X2 n=1 Tax=Quercus robur TaxID=38942 RepID=UPI002162E79C|nr:aluminum-activated malate transporter 8-like isoform X2 [Quercus robur]